MATEAATAKDERFTLIGLLPDVCLTPDRKGYPVPYPVVHAMDRSRQCSPNVYFRGKPAYLHNESFVDTVRGDEPGAGKGVVSRTHVRISHNIDKSPTVFVNGRPIVRTGDRVWMNWEKPGEAGGATPKSAAEAKAERWKCRQAQIAAAKDKSRQMPPGSERDRLEAAAARFERNNVAVEHARLADGAYRPGEAPTGWKNISNDPEKLAQHGLRPKELRIEGSNFGAEVYEPDPAVFGNDMKPTVAFKGIQNAEDWNNNFAQGVNRDSPYYERAVRIGRDLKQSGADVSITGHSLGGGLASAASRASGLPADTFNAAGLHPETVTRYGGSLHTPAQENINAYRVDGDVLTGAQEQSVGGTALAALAGAPLAGLPGALIGGLGKAALAAVMPDAVGLPRELPGHGDPVARHGMDEVIDGIEGQKKEDQAVLAEATGKSCA